MARIHGRNGALYVEIVSGGSASLVSYVNKYTMPRATDMVDVTAFTDTNKTYVSGLPDSKGSYGGFFDTATAQLYTAANDGIARKFYLYVDSTAPTHNYWYGTAFFDTSITGGVAEAVAISGNLSAASNITYVS